MRSAVPTVILLAAVLSGCESGVGGSLLYMTPYRLEDLGCADLKKRAASAQGRLKEQEALRDRAGASAAGPVINAVVYGPDHNRAVWEVRLYQDEIARKNCDGMPAQPEAPGVNDATTRDPAQAGGRLPGSQWPSDQSQSDPWSGNQFPGHQQPGSRWPGNQ